jgi:hypothetical protein
MLARHQGPFGGILEPNRDTYRHIYGAGGLLPSDKVGIMYTRAGGFIDFGHLRSIADLTKFYYDALAHRRRKGDVIEPPQGKALGKVTLLQDLPEERRVDVARSIAYSESVFHEIETYWQNSVGNRHSSFSPDDLISNFLGTYVAGQAIHDVATANAGDYNARFTDRLEAVMTRLGAVDRSTTKAALDRIEGTWVKGFQLLPSYLRRRNFDVWPLRPWIVDDLPGAQNTAGTFPAPTEPGFAIPADATAYYTADYPVPEGARDADEINADVVSLQQFGPLIQAIRADAEQEYGSGYDNPTPVGRVGP